MQQLEFPIFLVFNPTSDDAFELTIMSSTPRSLSDVKKKLLQELSRDTVNVLRVRELCRDNPGLIATAGLRVRIWTLLLLGSDCDIRHSERVDAPNEPCMEQQVLEADVKRTRGDVESFRSEIFQSNIKDILQGFCVKHGVQYKQGR